MFPPEVENLLVAADQARTGGPKGQAVELYTEALALVDDDERSSRSIRLLRGLTLVEMEDFEGGASELGELLPNLEGREQMEALLGLGRASMWMEQTDEALGFARRSLKLAERLDDREMRGPALSLLSQVHGQRGHEGDLGLAVELGDQALQVWVPGTRAIDLAAHESLHALNQYWVGRYAEAAELGRRGGDGASAGLALTALGRHEEAIEVFDAAIARQREADATIGTAYALNCSTAALRDLLDLPEARRRNGEATELFRRVGFASGVMQGEIDLLYTDLLDDAVASAERAWPELWERARDGTGWERWLAPGRLTVARAEISLRAERPEAAIEGALEAIEVARRIGRVKYDVSARTVLGTALLELGRGKDAVVELRTVVEGADRLGHPPTRWLAHAALGRALDGVGEDEGAAAAVLEAADTIRGFAETLAPERARPLLASSPVQEILALATR